jgi:methionine-gamma-lyase
MKKIIALTGEKLSDKTICVTGSKYGNQSLIGTDKIRWEELEFSRSPKEHGVNTTMFEYPTLEIGGWAFNSIPSFNPEIFQKAGIPVEYPFGGSQLYARLGLPQHEKLAKIISYLERVPGGFVAPSGVAASHMAVLFNLPKNGLILRSNPIYDCTRSAFEHIYPKWGIQTPTTDFADLEKLEADIQKYKPNKLYLETPANPTMAMIDLKKVYELAVKYDIAEIIVDNTFASPIIQKPIEIVDGDPYKKIRIIHSGTKHFTGGLDGVCWGYVSLLDWKEYTTMLIFQKDMGFNMSGLDAEAVLQHGMPTLDLRVKDQSANALKVATFLQNHPLIKKVNYPGLPPFKEMADKMFTGAGYGSTIYFELDPEQLFADKEDALKASETFGDILALQSFICLAVSLGKMNSLIENSWFMVHRFMDEKEKIKCGISPFGWRLSVGSENPEDTIKELTRILDLIKDKAFREKLEQLKQKLGKPKDLLLFEKANRN